MTTDADLMQGGQIIGQSLRQLGKDIKGDREQKRLKEQTKLLGEKFGSTQIGQTEMGQVVSLGLAEGLLDADKAIGQHVGMDPEIIIKKLVSDPNIFKDPAKMEMANKALSLYNSINESMALFEQRGKERAKWWGPEGLNARTAAGRVAKVETVKGAPVDLSPVAEAFNAQLKEGGDKNEAPLLKFSTIDLPGFDGIDKEIEVDMNRPWPEVEVELRNSNLVSAGLFSGENQKYSDVQINSIKQYYTNKTFEKTKEIIKNTNPIFKNPIMQDSLDIAAAAATERIFSKGLKGAAYSTDADYESGNAYKLDIGYVPKAVYNAPAIFEPTDISILSASPNAQLQWLKNNGMSDKVISQISSTDQLSGIVQASFDRINYKKQQNQNKEEPKEEVEKPKLAPEPKRIFMGNKPKDTGARGLGFK